MAETKVTPIEIFNPYKFLVYRNSAFTTGATPAVLQFDTKVFDTGSNVDVTTNKGRFTAPVAGFYQFTANFFISTGSAVQMQCLIYKNGSLLYGGPVWASGAGNYAAGITTPLTQLSAGDFVEAYAFTSGTITGITGSSNSYFGGALVSQT